MKQTTLRKLSVNAKFWYIENHSTVVEGVRITSSLALINGKYTMMNPDALVYKSDPRKVNAR